MEDNRYFKQNRLVAETIEDEFITLEVTFTRQSDAKEYAKAAMQANKDYKEIVVYKKNNHIATITR